MTKTVLIQIATPIIVPSIIAGIKWLWPRIPKQILPILCPGLGASIGVVVDLLNSGAIGANTGWGALLGAVGNNVREVIDQLSGNAAKSSASAGSLGSVLKLLAVGSVAGSLLGCAMVTQRADTPTPDGVKRSKVVGYTLFQSAQTLEKASAQNGDVQRVGMTGLQQQTDLGNVMANILAQSLTAALSAQGFGARGAVTAPVTQPTVTTDDSVTAADNDSAPTALPAGLADPGPGAVWITKVTQTGTPGREVWCSDKGQCWIVKRATMTKTTSNGFTRYTSGGLTFWMAYPDL